MSPVPESPSARKANRQVNPDRGGNRPVREAALPPTSQTVHLEGYGPARVFRIVTPGGGTEYCATYDLSMPNLTRQSLAERG